MKRRGGPRWRLEDALTVIAAVAILTGLVALLATTLAVPEVVEFLYWEGGGLTS